MKIKSFTQNRKTGPFRKNKTPLSGIESFSNSTFFYGAIVPNTQYSTSGDLIYSDNTNFYCIPKNNSMQTDVDILDIQT